MEMPKETTSRSAASWCGGGVAIFALLVLVAGWLLGVEPVRRITHFWSPMAPVTAVMLILLGAGLYWFERQARYSTIALLIALFLAAVAFAEFMFGLQSIVTFVTSWFGRSAELPAPDTSAATILLVLALLSFRTRQSTLHDLADVVAVTVGMICLQVLVSHGYHIAYTKSFTGFRQIAAHSTIAMMLLAFGATTVRPTRGLFAAMRGRAQSALQLRRLLPVTLVLLVIIGWLMVLLVREGLAGTMPDLISWAVVSTMVVLAIVLFVTSADMRVVEATVQKRQHELEEAKTEAETASETKSRFMAVMSHELRTPLTAVIGYADLLENGVAGELPEEAQNYLRRVRASGWHLVGLIDAVLLYAGGTPPAEQSAPARLDVNALASTVAALFESQVEEKGLKLNLELAPTPINVETDERKLRQILMNLVSNAVKFTESGAVTMRLFTSGDVAVVQIIDTGIGISPDHLAHIWEPFRLADDTHTRTRGGVGLGLAITRQLVSQLGGNIAVRSAVGKGTTFTVVLPRVEDADAPTFQLGGKRILVVDDEIALRRLMARSLTRFGAQATEADSADTALRIVQEEGPFDVVVTDISMPGMSGIQLAKLLAEPHPDMPILFVTGAQLDEGDMAEINALGGRLLRKPFQIKELARAVSRAELI